MRVISKSIILICILCIGVIGCQEKAEISETLVIGTSAEYPPFEFKKNGEVVGLDIDLVNEIGKRLDKKIKVVNMDYNAILPSLQSGRIDMAVAGITETPARKQSVDFSKVYFKNNLAVIVLKGSDILKTKSLEGKKVGVQLGSTMESYAQKIPDVSVIALAGNPELLQELKIGRIDGVINEYAQAIEYCKTNPELDFYEIGGTGEGYAIALSKGSHLTQSVSDIIDILEKNDYLNNLKLKWIDS